MTLYLDHHATTPIADEVRAAMEPYLWEHFGNASSVAHRHGRAARDGVEQARAQVASLLGARPNEIVFTSGATESNRLAFELARSSADGAWGVLTGATEHSAVRELARGLAHRGVVAWHELSVDRNGRVRPSTLGRAIGAAPPSGLISLMHCNNEMGAAHEIPTLSELPRPEGWLFHCDAAQGLGLVPLRVDKARVDLLSLSAHKFYGPKGVGALYIRTASLRRSRATTTGGGQESGLRSGTLNVPGIVGMGAAAALLEREATGWATRAGVLRDELSARLCALPAVHRFTPSDTPTHPGNLFLGIEGVDSAGLLIALEPYLSASAGAACSTNEAGPSHVLTAMGIDAERQSELALLRLGIGKDTTRENIEFAAAEIERAITELRARSPLWRAHLAGKSTEGIEW